MAHVLWSLTLGIWFPNHFIDPSWGSYTTSPSGVWLSLAPAHESDLRCQCNSTSWTNKKSKVKLHTDFLYHFCEILLFLICLRISIKDSQDGSMAKLPCLLNLYPRDALLMLNPWCQNVDMLFDSRITYALPASGIIGTVKVSSNSYISVVCSNPSTQKGTIFIVLDFRFSGTSGTGCHIGLELRELKQVGNWTTKISADVLYIFEFVADDVKKQQRSQRF